MPQSIIDVLTQSNPVLNTGSMPSGSNSTGKDWIPVAKWKRWTDFTYQKLLSIYQQTLDSPWGHPPNIDPASPMDLVVRDEKSLDYIIAKFILPHVNGALDRATSILRENRFYIAPGTWCYGQGIPDWGLVSLQREFGGKLWNFLPGDTKLSAKWRPEMLESLDDSQRIQWMLPVSQVLTYADEGQSRYGFIITDRDLVVLRFTAEPIGDGIASIRPKRPPTQHPHQRVDSGGTDISSQFESMSLNSFGAESYEDEQTGGEFQSPEYAVVPWTAKGKGKLTVKLSLFCLCLMAAVDGKVSETYPPLNSWSPYDDMFRHNTSGVVAKKLPSKAIMYEQKKHDEQNAEQNAETDAEKGHGNQDGDDDSDDQQHEDHNEQQDAQGSTHDDTLHTNQPTGEGSSSQYIHVTVTKRDHRICFKDARNSTKRTKKADWVQTSDGWVFYGSKHTYFTKKLP